MSERFCPHCGARLDADDRFCTGCGTAVSPPGRVSSMPTQRPRKRPFPWFAIALVILSTLFVVGIVFLLRDSSTSPAVELAAENDAPNLPYPEIARISVDDARERLDSDDTVFVDVRGAEQYATAHIAGAISIPLDALEPRSRDLAKDSEIITYCT